jgi:hypothetical protein
MPQNPRRLGATLAAAGFAADISWIVFNVDNAATADATYQLGAVPKKCRIRAATYVQESAATAVTSFTCLLQNKTGTVALVTALDIKALAAATKADFVLSTVAGALDLAAGDIIEAVFNETGGTVTAPDLVSIILEVQHTD